MRTMPGHVGSVARFRNRDWVVLAIAEEVMLLRPLTGTSDDGVVVHRWLSELLGYTFPTERIAPSQFPPPSPESVADAQSLPQTIDPCSPWLPHTARWRIGSLGKSKAGGKAEG
jgi:hypothetical protein